MGDVAHDVGGVVARGGMDVVNSPSRSRPGRQDIGASPGPHPPGTPRGVMMILGPPPDFALREPLGGGGGGGGGCGGGNLFSILGEGRGESGEGRVESGSLRW